MAYMVTADSIAQAWIKAVVMVKTHGVLIPTEYGNNAMTLYEPLVVHINKPFMEPKTCDALSKFKSKSIIEYCDKFLTVENTGHSYTYPNRLFDYPVTKKVKVAGEEGLGGYHWEDDIATVGNGDNKGFDQIKQIYENLKESPITRRCMAHTWVPMTDIFMEHCPCLQDIQFSILDGKLRMNAHFRSNDMLDASLSNNNGLHALQKIMAEALEVECGYIEVYSGFPHIYEQRMDDANKVYAGAAKYITREELMEVVMYED
ncbi:MAG: thymidylate synthase [Candidatus Babeliales bacterium]|jgi:thymidylate synthase (methanogen type)